MLQGRQRILIVGCSGSGKTTLSKRLGAALGLPVVHLDGHFWRPGWMQTPEAEWDEALAALLRRPAWIMDGNYDRTLDVRLARADAAVFLDLPDRICRYRVLKRIVTGYGRTRADLAVGCPEQIDPEFLRWVWSWRRDVRPGVVASLERAEPRVEIVRLGSPAEVRRLERQAASSPPERVTGARECRE